MLEICCTVGVNNCYTCRVCTCSFQGCKSCLKCISCQVCLKKCPVCINDSIRQQENKKKYKK